MLLVGFLPKGVRCGAGGCYQVHGCRSPLSAAVFVQLAPLCVARIMASAACVEVNMFKVCFKMPPESVDEKVIQLAGPENNITDGVLLSKAGLPPDIPHFDVELAHESDRRLDEVLLATDDFLRAGHTKDSFEYAMRHVVKDRGTSLCGVGVFQLPTAGAVTRKVSEVETEHQGENGAADVQMWSWSVAAGWTMGRTCRRCRLRRPRARPRRQQARPRPRPRRQQAVELAALAGGKAYP